MKKYIAILPFLLIGFISFAQVQRTVVKKQPDSSENLLVKENKLSRKEMMQELNLSKEQKQQLKEMKGVNKEAINAVENDSLLTPMQKKSKIRELKKQQLDKLKAILSPEQLEKFMKMKKEGKIDQP